VEGDLSRGTWLDDELGRQPCGDYARTWLRDNTKIGPRYRETCIRNLRLHMAALEDIPLRALTAPVIREWYAAAMRGKGGRTSIQQSYRFLHAVLATAVRDSAIPANPANIPGAGTDRAKERPVASVAQVVTLIEAITPRYRAAVLLGAWCGLRRGEIIALTPQDIDLDAGTVTIRTNRVELLETRQAFDAPPKTDAGKRTVTVPPHVLPILEAHIGSGPGLTACLSAATARRCAVMLSARRSPVRAARQACSVSSSTIFATLARLWPRRLVPRPRI
jgi:integrase